MKTLIASILMLICVPFLLWSGNSYLGGSVSNPSALTVVNNATIGGTLDVTGNTTLSGGSNVINGVFSFSSGNLNINGNIETLFGSAAPYYSIGKDDTSKDYRVVSGTNLTTDANVLFAANSQGPIFKSSTTVGLNGTIPETVGEYYFNTDTLELWIATGTAKNQFIHK